MVKNNRRCSTDILLAFLFALLLTGSVFLVSSRNYDLFETYRKYWTIISGLFFLAAVSVCRIVRKESFSLPLDLCLSILFFVGILESLFALSQFAGLVPSFNRYYAYTGSFENPAVFAMMLSFCVPVGIHKALSENRKTRSRLWLFTSAAMFVFVCFSESRSGMLAATAGTLLILFLESKPIRSVLLQKRTLLFLVPMALLASYAAYRFKADSANGRLLMWRVCLDMLKDRPLLGFGHGGFLAHYMEYQANYLSGHPDTPFLLLADNVNNPFNEYITLVVNHGIVGLAVLIIVVVFILKSLCENKEEGPVMLSQALVLCVWAMFSYPLSIPFVWVVMGLIVLVALPCMNLFKGSVLWYSLLAVSMCGVFLSIHKYVPERDWKVISERSIQGETERVLPEYARLQGVLSSNPNFLYNYGAELHFSGHYVESLDILGECSALLNDYDVQMLLADDYQQLGDTASAISHYTIAACMVPSKFLPLYYTMKLYETMGDTANAVSTASSILSKKIKVERSKSVQRIIREAEELLSGYKTQLSVDNYGMNDSL